MLLGGLGGCVPRPPTPPRVSDTAAVVPTAPPLRVGTSGDYPPFSWRTEDGVWTGFDVDVARAYGRDRGREVVLVAFRWPDLATRLEAGDFDVAMSGVTVRAERLLAGAMTAAVARTEAVVVVRARPGRPTPSLAALDRPRVRIAVNRGGHLEQLARARLPHATLVPIDDNRALPALLARGAVTAVVSDSLEAASFGACCRVAARLSHDRKAYWVRPGQPALAADLDDWLRAREEDGTLRALRALHFGAPGRVPGGSQGNVHGSHGLVASEEYPRSSVGVARSVDWIGRRLMLMPLVAAAKRAAGLPVEDRARERVLVEQASVRARAHGLALAPYLAVLAAEREAAKAVQRAAPSPRDRPPALAALRAVIDRLDAALAAEVARTPPVAVPVAALRAALRADADLPGVDDALLTAIATPLARLLAAPRAPVVSSPGAEQSAQRPARRQDAA